MFTYIFPDILDKKSPRLRRRYTDKLQVQEVITTALTPRSVHPNEVVTTKVIGLPYLDKHDKASKATSLSRPSEGGNVSPRSPTRKVYPSFGYVNKNKASLANSTHQNRGAMRYGQKSPGEQSSNSTSSSRDGQKSTCSNPNPSSHQPQLAQVENKGSLSDPSTKTEFKSAMATPRPQAAKTVNIEMDSGERYVRNSTTASDLAHRALPSVSPHRTLSQNRRVVNIVYPPFNKARGMPLRHQPGTRQAMSCDFESANSLNITGEKAVLEDTGHLLESAAHNVDCLPLKSRLTKVEPPATGNSTAEDGGLNSENTHKIVLPTLTMLENKAVNIT